MNLVGFKKTVREIMSEPGPNGTLSWGRIASSVLVIAVIVWVSRFLFLNHAFPSGIRELTEFMIAPYGANKVSTALQSFSQNPVSKLMSDEKLH